jgi:hypothetical protein
VGSAAEALDPPGDAVAVVDLQGPLEARPACSDGSALWTLVARRAGGRELREAELRPEVAWERPFPSAGLPPKSGKFGRREPESSNLDIGHGVSVTHLGTSARALPQNFFRDPKNFS